MTRREPVQELRFHLAYADCDPAQVVYYAAYYPWFERTSTEWWYSKGVRLDRIVESHGVAIASRASGCEYLATTRVFDHLACRMYVGRLGETSMTFNFEMVRLDDQVTVARGFNTLVAITPGGGPTPIPTSIRELLQAGSR